MHEEELLPVRRSFNGLTNPDGTVGPLWVDFGEELLGGLLEPENGRLENP